MRKVMKVQKNEQKKKAELQAKIQRILQKAEENDVEAQKKLAYMYWMGMDGLERDGEKAVYWLKKAAAQNDTEAMEDLGKIYRNGIPGIAKDDKEANFWFEKQRKTIEARQKNMFQANASITGDKVNIRTKPNTSSHIIKQLNAGHPVKATKQTKAKDGMWFYIQTASGTQGWVFGKYINFK